MTPLKTQFFGRIGKTLLEVQLAEEQLQVCLSYFLRMGEAATVEEIEAMAAEDRKKSLGKLITKIRERIHVDKSFDAKLTKFVEDRNAFAHRFLRVKGVSLHTDEGMKKGIEFMDDLSKQANEVRNVILGLMHAINDEDGSEVLEEDKAYTELAKVIFGGQP